MSHKKLFLTMLVPALVLFAGYGIWALAKSDDQKPESTASSNSSTSRPSGDTTTNPDTPTSNNDVRNITAAEVSQHSTEGDCWTIIDGNVYDLTAYIPRHPGGDDILKACGTDGSSLFNQRQTSDGESVGSGTPHSNNATSQLQSLLVGKLVD